MIRHENRAGLGQKTKKIEEYAIVLDFLPHGRPFMDRRIPVAQVLGIRHFMLLEVIPKKDVFLTPGEKVYIGDEKRDKIHHVKGKITISELTPTAQEELKQVIKRLVDENEQKYVEFFNTAGPISSRFHQLALLPGIGNKHMSSR